MAWAIITIYTSKCAKMDPQQLGKTSQIYSRCKKCDIEKTLGDGYHPLGSPKVNSISECVWVLLIERWNLSHSFYKAYGEVTCS